MALHGNHSVLLKGPGRQRSGSTISDGRSDFNRGGSNRNRFVGETGTFRRESAEPRGYLPGSAFVNPQYSGEIGSVNQIVGSGDVTPPNLAGGLNAVAPVTGDGDIPTASATMLMYGTAALTAAGVVAADIYALLASFADLSGDVAMSAALDAALSATSDLAGSGDMTPVLELVTEILADLTGSATVSSQLVGGLDAAADIVGSGVVSPAIVGVWRMAADITASGATTAALEALAEAVSALTGAGAPSVAMTAKAQLTSDVIVAGELLTTTNVAQAVWDAVADGTFSFAELAKIQAAVQFGKTVIVDHGDGTATIKFRDLADTKDVVVAEMDGSERTSVTRNP